MKKILFAFSVVVLLSQASVTEAALACFEYGGGVYSTSAQCPSNTPVSVASKYVTGPNSTQQCCVPTTRATTLVADYNRANPTSPQLSLQGGRVSEVSLNACPTACIDVSATCSGGAVVDTQKACPSSTLKCCSVPVPNPNPAGGSATTGTTEAVNITVSNPLKYDTVEGVLTSIMGGIKGIVVTLALLMIVIGGIMYILSLGNADNMKRAKSVILAALVGLAIVIAAPAFLREISSLLGWDNAPAIEGGTTLTLTQIATKILNFLLSIIGTLALIMLIISGIMYLTSAGNDTRMKQAKSIFIASLIGIAIAMASLVLVTAVARFFE